MPQQPPQNTWNDRAARGGGRRRDFSRPWYCYGFKLLAKHLDNPGGMQVLDVGCGCGEFLEILGREGFSATGVDGNPGQIETVRNAGFQAALCDLNLGLPFDDDSFDLVTCLEVIEHVARAEFLLAEIRRILKTGGMLLLSTPNFAYLNYRIHYLWGAAPWNEGIHLRFFTGRAVAALLRGTGFALIDRNSYGPIPILSSIMIRLLGMDPLLWRVSGGLEGLLAYDLVYLAK